LIEFAPPRQLHGSAALPVSMKHILIAIVLLCAASAARFFRTIHYTRCGIRQRAHLHERRGDIAESMLLLIRSGQPVSQLPCDGTVPLFMFEDITFILTDRKSLRQAGGRRKLIAVLGVMRH